MAPGLLLSFYASLQSDCYLGYTYPTPCQHLITLASLVFVHLLVGSQMLLYLHTPPPLFAWLHIRSSVFVCACVCMRVYVQRLY